MSVEKTDPQFYIPSFPDIFAYAEKQAGSREVLQRTVNWTARLSSASRSLTYTDWRTQALYRSKSAPIDAQKTFQIYLKHLDTYYAKDGDVISISRAAQTVEGLITQAQILINVTPDIYPMDHKLLTFGSGQLLGLRIHPEFNPESPNLKFFAEQTLWYIQALTTVHTDITPDYRTMPGQIGDILKEFDYEYLPPLPITSQPGYISQ